MSRAKPESAKSLPFLVFSSVARRILRSRRYHQIPYPLRRLGFALYHRLKPRAVRLDGHVLFLHPKDRIISAQMLFFGEWEHVETELFRRVVRPGMTVIDIGANIGHYTLLAARQVGDRGRVLAFEPDPDNFALLQKNIAANHYSNVEARSLAVAEHTGPLSLFRSPYNAGDNRIYRAETLADDVSVRGVRFDELVEHEGIAPDVIKIDVQGAEVAVLRGMQRTLRCSRALHLLVECTPSEIRKLGHDPREFAMLLQESGFSLSLIDVRDSSLRGLPYEELLDLFEEEGYFDLYAKNSQARSDTL